MKVNELMIGDLLKWKEQPGFNDEDRNMVLRVKNIFDDAIKIDGRFESYHISLFEPIPLTPEILERNGFTYIIVLGEVAPHPKLENFELDNHWEGDGYSWNGIPLLYVHQLQHALRLCGIEKEIEL